MRTKTLLLTAALCAAGIATSLAQTVYSVNAVGYVNLTIPVGYSMIANPLNAATNSLSSLISNPPNFSQFLRWNGTGFDVATFAFGAWDNDYTVVPGQGGFLNTDTLFTNTFVGEVMQGNLTNAFPLGYSIRSSQVPQAANLTALGLTAAVQNFDQVLVWTNNPAPGSFVVYTLTFGAWDPADPQIEVGQSFFLNTAAAGNWTRTFTVNQ